MLVFVVLIILVILINYYFSYTDKILDGVDITENDKLNVQKLEREFSQITNYDVFLNQPTIALTRIDISEHGMC